MKNQECLKAVDRDSKVLAKTSHISYFPLVVKKAEGATIEDLDGNRFIDFLSAASSLNTGSGNPRLMMAMEAQMKQFTQYTAAYSYNLPMIELAERLVDITPGDFEKKVCLGLCGSDANDAAIKFARGYTNRSKIITFVNGYHGSTYGAISLSAVSLNMRRKIGPFLPDVHHFPFSSCYRCPYGKEACSCGVECLNELKIALQTSIPAEEVAAVIIEPIQGDGGLIPGAKRFLQGLYDLCKEHGILFISEEVQQGMGRTGKWFGIEHFDIVPDGIILGKSLGGGLPVGAFVARAEIIDSLEAPAHIFTMAGNALCCAAAVENLNILSEEGFLEAVNEKGEYLKAGFQRLDDKYHLIGDIRGYGLSIAVELVKDKETKEKDSTAAAKLSYRCYEKGLIVIYLTGNCLRIQPPLTITYEEMDQALAILDEAMAEYVAGEISDEILTLSNGWK